jgi:hypothetical protein
MTKKTTSNTIRPAEQNLDSRYGEIGISAVAAALQFKDEVKNPAYAPARSRLDEARLADLAA